MSPASLPAEVVRVEYRLRPAERVQYAFLFNRQFRVFTPVGVGLCLLGAIVGIADSGWVLMAVGLTFALAFVWFPFATRLRSPQIAIDAASAGLDVDVGSVRSQLGWTSVRRIRRVAGACVLELRPVGTIPIPLRTLDSDTLGRLEQLFAASQGRPPATGAHVAVAGDDVLFSAPHQGRIRDAWLAAILRPVNAISVMLGVGLAAVGASLLSDSPADVLPQGSGWPIVGLGVVVVTSILWAFPLRMWFGGGAGTLTAPGELDIGTEGYRARLGPIDAWTAWSSFRSVRRVGSAYVLGVKGTNAEIFISTRGFTIPQREAFRAVLRRHGLDHRGRI